MLTGAIGDSSKQVRAAAYRCLCELDQKALVSLCRNWSDSSSMELRIRSAEAMEWIAFESLQVEPFLEELRSDAVRLVRTTADNALRASRTRSWVRSYVERIKQVNTSDAKTLFDAFPYGEAVAHLGNEETVKELQTHANTVDLPPNVLNWLTRICQETEKNVRKLASGEEQLWHGWEAIVEDFAGNMVIGGKLWPATFRLAMRPPEEPGDIGEWSGVAISEKPVSFEMFGSSGMIGIQGDKRNMATALFVTTLGEHVLMITGSGTYPERHA